MQDMFKKLIGLLNKADGVEKFENAIISVIPKILAQLCRIKINVKFNIKRRFCPYFMLPLELALV